MMKNILSVAVLATLLSACGGDGSATTSQVDNDDNVPDNEPETSTPVADATQPELVNPSLVKPVVTFDPSTDTSLRDWSSLGITQFDIELADMQMVHDAMTGELPYFNSAGEEVPLTCEALTGLYIDRILQYNDNPQPNGGLSISGALMINPAAMDIARSLDVKFAEDVEAGNNQGFAGRYIHCMPILLKDNYDTFDHPSTSASVSMLGHQAGVDAPTVAGLRDAGGVILGKAQQDEFAYFTTGFSGRTVLVTNPYNTQESPAGSSSGTGASIGARFAIGGTGSDTCQSIRHPSSVNGLVGIRPSVGTISRKGIFPLSHVRDIGGPMTKTVRDTALMLTAMVSIDEIDDPDTTLFPLESRPDTYLRALQNLNGDQPLAGKNIGLLKVLANNSTPDGGAGTQGVLIRAAVDKLEALGAKVYQVELPDFVNRGGGGTHYDTNQYFAEFFRDGGKSPRRCMASTLTTLQLQARPDHHPSCILTQGIVESLRVGPRTAGLVALSASGNIDDTITDVELVRIAQQRDYTTAVMDGNLQAGEVVNVAPSVVNEESLEVNGMAASVRDRDGNEVEGVKLDALVLSPGPSGGRTCDFGSTTQMASIVVPVGVAPVAIGPDTPRGMEIFTRRFDESTGLTIAYAYESASIAERVAAENPYLLTPDIEPALTRNVETIDEFNRRIQLALMAASSEQVEGVLDLEAVRRALSELTGNSRFD